MRTFTFVYLLAIASAVLAAALVPVRERRALNVSSIACGPALVSTVTATVTQTVTPLRSTVTVALVDSGQIAASLSRAIAIDSAELSFSREVLPGEPTATSIDTSVTTTAYLTYTEVVPAVEATLTPIPASQTSSVIYVAIGNGSTSWMTNFHPTESITIGTTIVTLLPIPASTASSDTTSNSTSEILPISAQIASPTTTVHTTIYHTRTASVTRTALPLSTGNVFTGAGLSSGWNATYTAFATLASGLSGSLPSSSFHSEVTTTLNTTHFSAFNVTAFPTANVTSFLTPSCTEGYGSESGGSYGNEYGKRQTCYLVFATIGGKVASWCNNWDGSTVVQQTNFVTTLTPTPVPSIESSTMTTSTEPSTLTTSITGPALTTTATMVSIAPSSSTTAVPTLQSSSTTSAAAAATSCGQVGDFVINFDGLPRYTPADPNTTTAYPPIFNPYDHFWWSDGWSYVPPPKDPYPPHDGTRLGVYIPSESVNSSVSGSPDAGLITDGGFGAGPRNYNNAYWFNADSAWIGCDNGADNPSVTCDFVATGWKYDAVLGEETPFVTEHYPQPPCPGLENCSLSQIFFNSSYQGMSSLSFSAVVQGDERTFFIDTIAMSWWNNTCAAGLERVSSRK